MVFMCLATGIPAWLTNAKVEGVRRSRMLRRSQANGIQLNLPESNWKDGSIDVRHIVFPFLMRWASSMRYSVYIVYGIFMVVYGGELIDAIIPSRKGAEFTILVVGMYCFLPYLLGFIPLFIMKSTKKAYYFIGIYPLFLILIMATLIFLS